MTLGLAAAAGLRVDAGAQVPGFPTWPGSTDTTPTTTGTTSTAAPAPPPPPVVDPGPLGGDTTHRRADAAGRGAVAANGLRPPLRSLWRQDFGALVSTAVTGDGRVYLESGGSISALELTTGRRLWTWPGGVQRATMAFGGGRLVVVTNAGVAALDAATGAVRWSVPHPPGSIGGELVIAGDLVVLDDDGLRAYDLATGAERWKADTSIGFGLRGGPAVAGDRIYHGGDCRLVAVDRRGGHLLWTRSRCTGTSSTRVVAQADRIHSTFGTAVVSAADGSEVPGPRLDIVGEDVGLSTRNGDIAAFSLATGTPLWSAEADRSEINDPLGTPLVVGRTLFQTRFEGTVEARDVGSGAVTWRGKLRKAVETFTGSSSASDYALAAGSGVLVVLRGSTVDALGSAAEAPRTLGITVPALAARLVTAGDELTIKGSVTGELMPIAQLETDPYPFDRFAPAGPPWPLQGPGPLSLPLKPDRNVRVRIAGSAGSAMPTQSYTLFVYPRIRVGLGAARRGRVRATISVRGARDLRFRGRRVHLYFARHKGKRMTRVGSARLSGPRRGSGKGVVRFRPPERVGRRDYVVACVPGLHRLGQVAGDVVQRRCGRRTIRL